ncbi:aldo/keto reductase [Martelella radicis]|uniref:Diketogulonate reductase-like aldo/keto reductase n=1 Tax=Martelella radicis TaxID=1397476 RepID=A0A7W6KN45_9HYPH|nr:aldo/keto reductase [Martelella radicis]MBB4124185.1 diketogulonate reductase-like aldo/keto reductase [Martelella radicis]
MKTITLPGGETVAALGQGTWYVGDDPARRADEIEALNRGIDLGMNVIDTAEMYGNGRSESRVGEAIAGRRDEVFLVSKVLPGNASRKGTIAACEASLDRLGTDRIDLYLLHWRGGVPLHETISAFETLLRAGKIRNWGVSNFDVQDMEELLSVPGGEKVAVNQVLYNLSRRGIEWDLLDWCADRNIPVMAYSPVEQARLLRHPGLRELAVRLGLAPAQLALAWVLRRRNVMAIPKAASFAHVNDNAAAADLTLDDETLRTLDRMFAPPSRSTPLEIL